MKPSARRALLVTGVILCVVLVLKGSSLLVPSGNWAPEGTMATARLSASAALLGDGRILITGGDAGTGAVTTVDFFNEDGTISSAPAMSNARSGHISVTLKDGRVLVAGGITAGGSTTSTAEIFDPITNSWTTMGLGMVEARSGATAALLTDGRVLVAGGQNGSTISSTIEIFDPALGAFTSAGMMSSPRTQHAMTALQDGRVLIVGGFNGSIPVASTDIFDSVTGMVSAGPNLSVARFGHSATTLLNGPVVVIGGNKGNANPAQMDATPAEMVDFTPATPAFTTLATNLATPREGHLAILLPNNNNILIVGGTSAGATIASAELFIPQETPQGVWTYGFGATGALTTARSRVAGSANQLNAPSSTLQRNGVVMVAGGNDASGNALNTTEAYGYPTVQTDQSDYPPGTTVTITGSGFQPNEVVTIQLVESPQIDTHGPYTVQADANGTFADGSFSTDLHDINLQFYLSAIGGTSGFQAQNTFTDSKPNTVTLSPTSVTVAPGGSAQYTVTVNFNGNLNNPCTSPLSIETPPSLPTGAAASFSPTSVTGSNSNPNPTSTLTITTTNVTPPGSTTFNVLAGSGAGCQAGTTTGIGTLVVVENTATTLISSVNPTVFGQSTTLTATVTQVTGPTTPNAGTVTFKDGANTLGTGTLNASGVATLAVSTLTAGSHSLTASYAGVTNTFGASTSNTVTQTVNQATTTPSLTSSANPSVFSQSVTFTATVTVNSPGAGTIPASETVTFKDGATTIGTGTTNASGAATFATSALTVATHSITAVYAGDTNFATSTSTAISQVVNKANTTTALTSSANPSVFGQSVTFTATVTANSPGAGSIPAGETVTFKDGATTLGTGTTNASGVATFATSALTVATHSVTAVDVGDANFATSTSGAVSQVVNPANTTTTVTSSANPSVFGQPVTFTATVTVNSPGAGTIPAGDTVTFKDGVTIIGAVTTNASGVATFATSTLAVATHSVTAVYVGDANFATSTSTAISQVVNKASTTTTITNDLSPATVVGQAYSVTVSVTINAPGAGTIPNGDTVTVSDGSATCTVTLSSTGGSCSLTSTTAGNKIVTATYNGDANFNASTSAGVAHTVNKANTTTIITSNTPNPSTVGQSVTFNYTVTVNSPAAGTLTGNVTVSDSLGDTCTGTVAAGTCSVTFNTAGTKTLTASYAGDTNFNTSASTGTSQTVNPKLVVTSTAFAILTGTCSSQVSVQTQNANGSAANQTPGITLNLSSNSGGGKFFSDPSCNTQVSSVAINGGTSTASFYYSDTIIGIPLITLASTGLTSVIQPETITGLRFGTGAFSVPVNTCSAVISLQSANSQSGGGPTSLTQATTINLISSPASGKFYSDAACTTQITSTTISPAIDAGHDSPNFFFENTSAGSSTLTGSAGTASAQQTESVVTPPSISKAFGAAMIPINGTTSLTFTITNPAANTVALTGVAFTDNLPAGLVVATPNGLSSTCGGTTTAAAGGGTVGLTNGTTAINGSCAIIVNVTGTNSGVKNNSVTVGSTNGGAGNTSTASITVASPPTISKAFGASSITLGSSTSVTFTINNTNTIGLTGVAFTDNLPAGLVVATPNGLISTCGGTTTSVASSSSASLSGGTVAASSSCSISLNVTGTALGVQNNTAGTIASTESGPGATSNTATLTITGTPPSITSSANTTFTAGAPGSFTVTTSGTPTPSLSDGGATLPGSVTFHDNGNGTATLAGTATAAGSYQFTITAQNGVTPNATQLFTLTVAASTITHLALTPATTTITAGGSQVYTAEGLDLYNNPAGDVTSATVFAIAPDGSCGAPNPGNNTCTATVADMNGSSHTVTGTYMNSAMGSASLTVNAASPTQLVITSNAFAIIAGQCSGNITVTSQDQYGNTSNISNPTQVNLSSASSTGKFYSDSTCQTQIAVSNGKTSVNIAGNSSSQTFAYADTTPSPLPDSTTTITAADDATILTSGSQAETILQLVFTTSSFTVTQNTCSAQITLTAKNAKGTATNVTVASTLGLTSTSNGATFYSDNACAMAITPTGTPLASDVTLGSGASAVNFSYEDSAAGNPTITATIGGYSVAQQEQIGTPPSVTSNPSGQAVTYGSNAIFTAAASGTPTPTVQWQVSSDGTNWNNVGDGGVYSGATTTTLTLTVPPVSLSGTQYRAVFTNAVGSANSNAASLTVNPEPLMLSIIGDPTKTYDATTTATLTSANFSISGLVGTDKFTVTQTTGMYASASAGSGITVTASLSASNFTPYGSTVANNYSFPASASGTGTISRKSVTASITASDKNYDGTNAATITSCTIPGKVGNDDVACSVPAANATFASSSANSTPQTVTATGITLTGTAAGNYMLSSTTATTTAKINTAALIITASSGTMTFGGAPPMISAMYSGFVNGETAANLMTQPVCGTNATSASPVGTYISSCSGAVDTNYTISYVPGVVTVTAASTMTAASSSENPSSYGQSVSFMATVTNTATGAAPTGSVQFVVDGSNFGLPVALTPSSNTGTAASGATTTLMAGSHTVTANYMNADGNFTNSNGTLSGGQTVNPATTSTALSSATNPSVLGQAVAFTATVTDTPSNDTATPTGGTVSFYEGSLLIGSVPLNAGSATFTTAILSSASPHAITASFNGDANFSASMTSSAVSQTVNARASTTAVSLSPNTVVVGQASTVTVIVTDAATTGPSGLPGVFALTANSLNSPRTGQAAALLPNGTVLVVGGQNSGGVLSSGEIYDPSAGAFTATTSSLNTMRAGATATLLNDETILVVGGSSDGTAAGALSSAEIFDPIAGTFTALTGTGQSITVARFGHTATLLPNGKVVVAGGQNSSGALNTMEVYDPPSQTFTAIGDTLSVARTGHAATLLMNGTILFTGGSGLASAEIYDPVAHTSTPLTASMTTDRTNHAAVLLPDGNVLVAGGMSAGSAVKSTELYNSAAGTFAATGNMQKLRSGLTATILDSGRMLVVGGSNSTYPAVASAELYTPSFDPLGTATVSSSDITDNITGACMLTLTGTGATTCQLADAPSEVGANPHTIAATYNPASDQVHSSSNNSSQSDGKNNLTVNKADTSTTVASSVNPSTYGQTVTFTATVGVVSPGSGAPTGTVQFEDNGSPIGSPITLSGTTALFTTTATQFTAGGHSITAGYSGDANFNATGADAGSTATALAQTVQKATPVFSNLTASQTISYGTPSISLAGTISAPCGMGCTVYPATSEMVSITINGVTATPAIGSNGSLSATFNTSTIPASMTSYAITYSYNTSYADTNFKSATDGSTTLTVQKATPIFSNLTASQTIIYGTRSIALAGTISAPCGTGCTVYPPNTETVSITINGVTIAPAIGSTGSFSTIFSTNTIPASATPYMITYSYNTNYADTNFKSATDASTTLTVNTRPIAATLTAQNKTYDGTTSEPNANMGCSLTGVLPGDTVACTATSGTFDGSNVGAHTVTATVTISGAVAGNYTLGAAGTNVASTSAMAPASITTRAITATLTAQNKTYDGTASEPNANMSCSLTGVLSGDTVTCTATSGTFNTSQVATANQVTATVSLSGAASGNYTLGASGTIISSTTAMAPASITVATPLVTVSGGPFAYDGNPHSATVLALGVSSYAVPGVFVVTYNGISTIPLNAGTYIVSAGFTSSDPNYGSSVGIGSITINPATTSTAVSSSPNPSNWGNVITLTATVANTLTVAAPTGSVSFYNAASGATCSSLGTSTLLDTVQLTTIGTSQQASTSTPNLPVGPGNTVGTDAILACYNYNPVDPNYNANFVASNGTTTQTVNPAPIAALVPSSLSFGGQQGGTTSGAQTVTICNGPSGTSGSPCFNAPISTAALVISNIGFTNPNTNPVYFNQTSTCPIGGTGVPVGGSCASNVKFAPPLNAQGIATAFLTVTDNNENVAGSVQSASLVGAGTSAVTGVGSLSTYAIFGTASGCSIVNVSGNGIVDSFGNSNSSGNVGTNGNVTLSGNPVVNGAVYSPIGGTGNCSTKTMTGLSTSGKAQATGGLQALSGPVNYPLPPAPNPAPPTTTQNISGSCGSISGCSNNGSKNVTLAPGQYGNLSISGGTIVNVSGGNYNINSLTLSGNSTLVVTPNTGAVVLNLAGKSLSGGNAVLDFSGGSMSNPSGMASNLQLYYAGSQPMKLSGGTGSYAVVYAPNAPVNVSGGSHFYGSIIGSTVNSSGNTAIHYPTSLPSISSGNSIWFSSNGLTVKGLPNTGSVKLYVTNASINFMANGTTYNLPVPNAVITFSSTATSASTTWDATNNRWSSLVPMLSVNGNATIHTFFDGVAFQVPPGGFPTGIQNVTWQAAYSTSTTGLSFNWQWGAAVYSTLPATGATGNYSSFGVNSLDNSVPAGTPVNYEGNLVFGDTGAGYTGLYANFVGVVPTIAPMNIAPSSYDFGGVTQGSTATATVPFVLTNNDSVPYTIGSIQMTGTYAGDFVQTNSCPISPNTLGAGASCTFTVTFTPSTSGGTKETAKIVINDNANNSPQTVFLKGTVQ